MKRRSVVLIERCETISRKLGKFAKAWPDDQRAFEAASLGDLLADIVVGLDSSLRERDLYTDEALFEDGEFLAVCEVMRAGYALSKRVQAEAKSHRKNLDRTLYEDQD